MSRERVSAQLKQLVIERAYACCEYCTSLARYSMSPFAVDHIIPRSRGGKTMAGNLALVCQGCNGAKYIYAIGEHPPAIYTDRTADT